MAKVKDAAPAVAGGSGKTAAAPSAFRDAGRQVAPFLANFARADVYKPAQGWHVRLATTVGLALLLGVGVYRYYKTQLDGQTTVPIQLGVPLALAVLSAWVVFRIVQYPPFVDFLIATEGEMNKVSWTTRADLKRATIVVIVTVFLMSLYLFGVDFLWSALLQKIGVLQFSNDSFGSQAG